MKDEKPALRGSDLRWRTRQFALRIIRLYQALPERGAAVILGRQLLKAGTSVGAHYRECLRAKSDADFINKVQGALQELDETSYWLELLAESNIVGPRSLKGLLEETDELIAILSSIAIKARRRNKAGK